MEILAKKNFFYFLLACAEIVERVVKVFFVELAQAEDFRNGLIASPTGARIESALNG